MVVAGGVIASLASGCAHFGELNDAVGLTRGGLGLAKEAGVVGSAGNQTTSTSARMGGGVRTESETAIDQYEPNDDLLHPAVVPINSSIKATIDPGKDIDVFKFHVASNKREVVNISFLNPTQNLAPKLIIYNQNREEIGSFGINRGAAQANSKLTAQPNQDYYVLVFSSKYGGSFGLGYVDKERSGKFYTLEIRLADIGDKFEPNDNFKNAVQIKTGQTRANINPARDVDFYKFSAPKKGVLKISLVNPTLNLTPAFVIYNHNREKIKGFLGRAKGAAQLDGSVAIEKGKTYYLQVFSGGNYGQVDNESAQDMYTLKLEM